MDAVEHSNLTCRGTLCNGLSIPLRPLNGRFVSVILQNSSKVISKVSSSVFSSHEDFPNLRTDLHLSNQSPCFTVTHILEILDDLCTHPSSLHALATDLNNPLSSMALLSVIPSANVISCDKLGRNHCCERRCQWPRDHVQ